MNRSLLAALGLLLAAAPAMAQDPTVVDPDHYKVEFENDYVRVLRVTYGPGEQSVMHWHPNLVAVMLTDANFLMHAPDGTSEGFQTTKGQTTWTDSGTHLPENVGDAEAKVILVELKEPAEDECM